MSHDDKTGPWNFDEALARQLLLVPLPSFELRTTQRPTVPSPGRRKRNRTETPIEVPRPPRAPGAR